MSLEDVEIEVEPLSSSSSIVDAFAIAPIRQTQQEKEEKNVTNTKRKATATASEISEFSGLLKTNAISLLAIIQGSSSNETKIVSTTTRKRGRLTSDSTTTPDSSSPTPPIIRLKWWDKVDTWISTHSWKKVLVLIGPSGSGKTHCVHSYIAPKLGRIVKTLKPYAFCQQTMEQQMTTLLQDVPAQATSGVSQWLLHIPYCHPLEMMRMTDWKFFEGLFIHSHLSLRTTLPLIVIEARSSEFHNWHYSPLKKIWKQSPNAVDVVYSQGWTSRDLIMLGGGEGTSVVTRCIERSHSDARQFLLHMYMENFRPSSTQSPHSISKINQSKSRLFLASEKGMTPVLADLFQTPGVTMSELKSVLRFFPLQDNLDYRFVDSCLAMVGNKSTFPSMKMLDMQQQAIRVEEEGSEPLLISKSKTEAKKSSPRWIKPHILPRKKQPRLLPAHTLSLPDEMTSLHQRKRLDTLSQFYSHNKAFQFGLVPERYAFESTRSALQLASLAMAHSIKWEWDNAGFQCKTDHLWSEIGKRLPHVRLFVYTNNDE